MEKALKITLIQTDTLWEQIDLNLRNLDKKFQEVPEDTDLVVLPELFSTGFTMNGNHLAEKMNGKTVNWMLNWAKKINSVLVGSVLIKENGDYFNRLIVAFPSGKTLHYDKRHLFSFAGEHQVFSQGKTRIIFEYKGFTICPLICYDLRFPVWARNTENYDVLLYTANWPNARINAWDTLLKARSIENLCYTIGLNRVGIDNNDLVYTGHSSVYDAMGDLILAFEENKENVRSVVLSKAHLTSVRKKFSFLEDRDSFKLIVD